MQSDSFQVKFMSIWECDVKLP